MSDIVKILPYSIDLNETIKKTELHTLFVVGDNQAHRFEVEIKRGSEVVDLNGATVTGYFTNFKEKTTIEVPGKAEGGKAIVTLKKSCYALHGQFVLLIQVKAGGVDATIFQGDGFMRASKAEKIVYEDFVIYDVDTLLAQIAAMKTATKEANEATKEIKAQMEAAKEATDDANDAAEGADGWARAEISAEKLAAGSSPTANVSTAEDGHKVIKLGIPKGDTGATPQITFEVATGLPGTDVQISVSGTAEAPHLLLTIPRGNTGSLENMPLSNAAPKALGTAGAGTSEDVSRADHVHPMPSASDVGALPSGGTAANSSKLGGKAWSTLMLEMFPIGSMYTTSANSSPGSYLGGTWDLIDKQFASQEWTSDAFTAKSGVAVSSASVARNGHSITFRITLSYNAEMNDNPVELGTFNFDALGVDWLKHTLYLAGVSDTGNGISLATIDSGTGMLTHTDRVVNGGGAISANAQVNYCGVFVLPKDAMLDSACNQFIWKRVS